MCLLVVRANGKNKFKIVKFNFVVNNLSHIFFQGC